MSEAQDETFSPRNITVLGGLLLLAIVLGEVVIGQHGDDEIKAEPVDTMEDMAMRLQPVVSLEKMRSRMTVAAAGDAADKPPDQLYQGACMACHSTGAAGAPKIGDAGAWKARFGKGLDALVSSAINGVGAMPPRGGSQYSDDQIRSIIEYIQSESK